MAVPEVNLPWVELLAYAMLYPAGAVLLSTTLPLLASVKLPELTLLLIGWSKSEKPLWISPCISANSSVISAILVWIASSTVLRVATSVLWAKRKLEISLSRLVLIEANLVLVLSIRFLIYGCAISAPSWVFNSSSKWLQSNNNLYCWSAISFSRATRALWSSWSWKNVRFWSWMNQAEISRLYLDRSSEGSLMSLAAAWFRYTMIADT